VPDFLTKQFNGNKSLDLNFFPKANAKSSEPVILINGKLT